LLAVQVAVLARHLNTGQKQGLPQRRGRKSNVRVRFSDEGTSLIELTIAVALVLILAAFAIPNTATMIANMRLRNSASEVSALSQLVRMQAVRNNTTSSLLFGLPTGQGACVDSNSNGQCDATEPLVQFGGTVFVAGAPSGAGGSPAILDGAGGPLGWTATAGNVSFNARGSTCDNTHTPCATGVNYVIYLTDTRAFGRSAWAAISVTAAGRSKVWLWNGAAWTN
jgi:Tfp pilus assembly protein FimT